MLYARATNNTRSRNERGPIDITSRLSTSQLTEHNLLVDIRNRAIAHVYSGERLADAIWHEDKIFLVEDKPGWRVGAGRMAIQFHRGALDCLIRQIPVARIIILDLFHKYINQVTALINENPVSPEIFGRHVIDPVSFLETSKLYEKR